VFEASSVVIAGGSTWTRLYRDSKLISVPAAFRFAAVNKCDALDSKNSNRIAAIAPFAGLRCFPEGRGFKQWTGDDSKALMKVCHVKSSL